MNGGTKERIALKNNKLSNICMQNIKPLNLSSMDSWHKIMTIIFFCNPNTITQHVEETYLKNFERI